LDLVIHEELLGSAVEDEALFDSRFDRSTLGPSITEDLPHRRTA
jgi:hypothetical protein